MIRYSPCFCHRPIFLHGELAMFGPPGHRIHWLEAFRPLLSHWSRKYSIYVPSMFHVVPIKKHVPCLCLFLRKTTNHPLGILNFLICLRIKKQPTHPPTDGFHLTVSPGHHVSAPRRPGWRIGCDAHPRADPRQRSCHRHNWNDLGCSENPGRNMSKWHSKIGWK